MGAGMKGRNGKKELVYSPVLKVNRVANVHFQMASVPPLTAEEQRQQRLQALAARGIVN